jgi:demethylmenaquinone methyltransferase/2-methoxy-6-polyprenyl-1,4-benzoquinol methylase
MSATELKLPVTGGAEKRSYVRGMFAAIAPSYDLLNHLLSLNADRRWRRLAVDRLGWERSPGGRFLDLCSGTMDLAAELGRRPGFHGRVVAADFVPEMLRLGVRKAPGLEPLTADALELPFGDATFDGATVGFGVRNFSDLDAGLREAARVLKPGARLVVLECSQPPFAPFRRLYYFYFRHVLPRVGRLVSRHADAYTYLPESVLAFPGADELQRRMEASGFAEVGYRRLFLGIVAIHVGVRVASGKW